MNGKKWVSFMVNYQILVNKQVKMGSIHGFFRSSREYFILEEDRVYFEERMLVTWTWLTVTKEKKCR